MNPESYIRKNKSEINSFRYKYDQMGQAISKYIETEKVDQDNLQALIKAVQN